MVSKYAIWRAVRVLVAVVISGIAVQYGDSTTWIVIGPVLSGISKWLRDNYSIDIKIV